MCRKYKLSSVLHTVNIRNNTVWQDWIKNPVHLICVIRKNAQGKQFKRELSQDSTGVREFFAWAVQIFRVVYENKVVFADEMDRVFFHVCLQI